jgi:hypothetical protein
MVDQLLGGLFGGQDDDDDDRRRSRARDFVSRYEQGPPHEGYDDDEVLHNYRSVEGRLSPQEYEEAAAEAFNRMPAEQRREMRRMMKERSGGRFDVDNDDPRELARMTSRFREQDSSGGGLAGLLGFGGGGGGGGDLLSASGRGGGSGGLGDLMSNPVAKAAMAGVAAIAMKKMIGR